MAGVTPEGFVPQTIEELREGLRAGFRQALGAAVNVDDRSRDGQLINIFAEQLSDAWEGTEAVSLTLNPNAAAGTALDNLCALTGTTRLPPSNSFAAQVMLTGTPTTVVDPGKVASVTGTGAKFAVSGGTIAAATAWAPSTLYTAGAVRTNAGKIYLCTTGGTSAASGGPSTTGSSITDGTVVWRYMGAGTGYVYTSATAVETGPVQAYSGTLTTIDTAVSGWQGVNNVLDAVPGNDMETDSDLRARRVAELGGQGTSTVNAIRAFILRILGVTACFVFENTTDATVGGLPPHSFEALVEGGDETEIAQAIFDSKPAGIATVGTSAATIIDAAGIGHLVSFSRPQLVLIYVNVTKTVDPDAYPSNGIDQSKALIVGIGNDQPIGRDAIADQVGSWLYPRAEFPTIGVRGTLEVAVTLQIDMGEGGLGPPSAEIPISVRQKAVYDTSRIDVVLVNGEP